MKKLLILGIVLLAILGVGVFLFLKQTPSPEVIKSFEQMTSRELALTCNKEEYTVLHIHPQLDILISDKDVEVPANIGIETQNGCLHPLHTHDATGEVHVESPVQKDFTLADFFAVWGKTFNKDQILEYKADDTHKVVMTVNDKPSTEFENLVLKDKDKIVISYEPK